MSAAAGPRILVVDDDSMMRFNIAGYLEDSGYYVLEAGDGDNAIAAVREQPPDLVLCDLRMPGRDGLDVMRELHDGFPELPVIAVSGTGVLNDAVDALRAGAWDFVIKPIQNMAVLEHAVTGALHKARLIRDNRRYQQDLEQANRTLRDNLQQMREDASAARRIQRQIMPERRQRFGPYAMSRCLLPSLVMSGDFVDYFAIDRGHIGFYLADVSGHGVSSAFVTVLLKSYVNSQLERLSKDGDATVRDPQQLLEHLNYAMLDQRLEKYLTIFYGVIDSDSNRLDYCFGGHYPSPVLFDGSRARFLPGRGPPIGLFRDAVYDGGSLALPEQFTLALFSDGILEVLPGESVEHKQSRLLKALEALDNDADGLIASLGLGSGQGYPDDITLLLLQRERRPALHAERRQHDTGYRGHTDAAGL
jgi:sigma-B regulation protein RsbU (phosphoserine phosphatase)